MACSYEYCRRSGEFRISLIRSYGDGISNLLIEFQAVSYAVMQHVNGVAEEDCQFFHLEGELEVVF